ncbi:type I pullulanase [Clostridium sp. SYSU_GA19001]|uniref:type I pullulanase n=1 Tax=Clostridium caldaquaticum TaxID=2940653 RepID=UPI0020776E09|nr:type I pullulanase [Clostridium caldaquaticum]MCM8711876.1 type I pullulanase [Clostridium caldaquaticum]
MFYAVVTQFNKIKIILNNIYEFHWKNAVVINGNKNIDILQADFEKNSIILLLKNDINIKDECFILYNNTTVKAIYGQLFNTFEFNRRYYTDEALGCFYSQNSTLFKVWSPAASSINLLLYKSGDPSIDERPASFPMSEKNGVWSLKIDNNLNGFFYTYEVTVYGKKNEAVDPYAKALGINGHRAAIIDFNSANPNNFEKDISPKLENLTDAIIYETSIRDISMHKDSGVQNKGKFLGLAEENTKSSKGLSTCLSHILELGVTHVQLMPIYDFSYVSTDERNPVKYNWGYDPQNYNCPEGSYSTNPYNPITRILELKTLVQTMHKHGLCINMDVVYNHVFNLENENLEKIFPGYYFRFYENGTPSNGSGCSNDTASERLMMRKFIVDSVYYWAKEYHIDGFRFDLMGIHDITTMNVVREKLNSLNRPIMLYGEGWNLNTMLPEELKANMKNSIKMPHIGHFNDIFRNSIRGNVFIKEDKGFVSGKEGLEEIIKNCIVGCTDYFNKGNSLFQTPDQSINYVSAHDNNTLWDKLEFSNPDADKEELKAMHKLSNAIVLTSQGIAFLHSGAEFCRTKYGVEDSVKSGDAVNCMDWDRKSDFLDVMEYYKGLIKLRREHSAFRMNNVDMIRKHLEFLSNTPKNVIAFILKNYANNDTWKDILVIYNGNKKKVKVSIPEGYWNIVADKYKAGVEILRTFNGNYFEVDDICINVLYR